MDDLIRNLGNTAKMSFKDIWAKNKLFFIIFGIVIFVVKFHDIIFDILVKSSKNLVKDADKKNDSLLVEQNQASSEAHALIQESQKLNSNKPTVDENWYKDEK